MPKQTAEQTRAIRERTSSVVLSSGAGCGKTFVLTARYLSHLIDDGAEVAQILAITFTDRAAREMRDRIRQALLERRQQERGSTSVDYDRYLRDLETAPISTIHAFCGNLLRAYAVQAGIDPAFEVLESVLAGNLQAEAKRTILQGLLLSESRAGKELRELIVLHGWNTVGQAIDALLQEPNPQAWSSWLQADPKSIAEDWFQRKRRELLPLWRDYLLAASPELVYARRTLQTVLSMVSDPTAQRLVKTILDEIDHLPTQIEALPSQLEYIIEWATVRKAPKKHWPSDEIYEAVKSALEELRRGLKERFALFLEEPKELAETVRLGQCYLRVAEEVFQGYQARKQRAGVLDFQDLLIRARQLLYDRPEVRDALRQRFRYVLLDEFQDTDPIQMDLVRTLLGEIGLEVGKLFAVGDHKQSIYRFRGAEVRLFQQLRQSVPETGRLGLTINFRSQPPILDFVNGLCHKRLSDYEPLQSLQERRNPLPCIEFLWSVPPLAPQLSTPEANSAKAGSAVVPSPPTEETENDGDTSPSTDRETAEQRRRREADAIAQRIRELLLDDTPRIVDKKTGQLRRVRAGDIVLLFRSMSSVATYETALRRLGLDYYLVGGRAFFAQQEIFDLLNLLRVLENPQDSFSLAGVLRSPFCCLSDETLFVLSQSPSEGLWSSLTDEACLSQLPTDQRILVERAARHLQRWRNLKDRLPIPRLIGAILDDSAYDAALQFEFLGERKLANLWKLIDLARLFDRSALFGLADLIQRLDELVREQPREEQAATHPETADIIKIMSIHQAKGLEYPVVFIPDFAAATHGGPESVARWDRELGCLVRPPSEEQELFSDFGWRLSKLFQQVAEWEEDLRILYVACTRARDLLILAAAFPERLNTNAGLPSKLRSTWMLALSEQFDLSTGLYLGDPLPVGHPPVVTVRVVEPTAEPPIEVPTETDIDSAEIPAPRPTFEVQPLSWRLPTTLSLPRLELCLRNLNQLRPERNLFTPEDAWIDRRHPLEEELIDQEDTEHHWSIPLERLGGCDDTLEGRAEAILRSVLARWRFDDIDGWSELLTQAIERDPNRRTSIQLENRLRNQLTHFAESELRRQLVQAARCLRDVEFLMPWPRFENDSPARDDLPVLHGLMDLLWQDRQGDWHLVALESRSKPLAEHDPWLGRKSFLAIQAWAVRSQWRVVPRTIGLLELTHGRWLQEPIRRIDWQRHFQRLWQAIESVRLATEI